MIICEMKIKIKSPVKESVLAARCCCKEFVPNWCCRGDVYFRRITQLVQERQNERESTEEFSEMRMSGRDI